jgi:phosphohistidine swiveling domain-containing protein
MRLIYLLTHPDCFGGRNETFDDFRFEKKHVMGVIAEKGSVNQHASMIAQSKAIPSMLIPNASALIKNNDFV